MAQPPTTGRSMWCADQQGPPSAGFLQWPPEPLVQHTRGQVQPTQSLHDTGERWALRSFNTSRALAKKRLITVV